MLARAREFLELSEIQCRDGSEFLHNLFAEDCSRSERPRHPRHRRGDVTSSEARLMWSSDLTVLILVLTPCVIWAMLPQFAAIIIGFSRGLMSMPFFFSYPTQPPPLLWQITIYGITSGSNGSSSCIIMNTVILFRIDALKGLITPDWSLCGSYEH